MAVDWSKKTIAKLEAEINKRVEDCSAKSLDLHVAAKDGDPDINSKISASRAAAASVCRIALHAIEQCKRKHDCAVAHHAKLQKIRGVLDGED